MNLARLVLGYLLKLTLSAIGDALANMPYEKFFKFIPFNFNRLKITFKLTFL